MAEENEIEYSFTNHLVMMHHQMQVLIQLLIEKDIITRDEFDDRTADRIDKLVEIEEIKRELKSMIDR